MAGTRLGGEFWSVGYLGRRLITHRIIWKMVYGEDAISVIDHIDRNIDNNDISNLRLATTAQNAFNRKADKDNKLGVKGVHLNKNGKFVAQIQANKIHYRLGYFNTLEEAAAAYAAASKKLHGEFGRVA